MKKKLFLIVILFMVTGSVFAVDFLGLQTKMELGYSSTGFGENYIIPEGSLEDIINGRSFVSSNNYYLWIEAYIWVTRHFYIGGGSVVQVTQVRKAFTGYTVEEVLPNFNPTFTNYTFEMGINIGPVTVFFAHECTHPQVTYPWAYKSTHIWGEGAVDRVGIRFNRSYGKVGTRGN